MTSDIPLYYAIIYILAKMVSFATETNENGDYTYLIGVSYHESVCLKQNK